jgi:hypothetical protein
MYICKSSRFSDKTGTHLFLHLHRRLCGINDFRAVPSQGFPQVLKCVHSCRECNFRSRLRSSGRGDGALGSAPSLWQLVLQPLHSLRRAREPICLLLNIQHSIGT